MLEWLSKLNPSKNITDLDIDNFIQLTSTKWLKITNPFKFLLFEMELAFSLQRTCITVTKKSVSMLHVFQTVVLHFTFLISEVFIWNPHFLWPYFTRTKLSTYHRWCSIMRADLESEIIGAAVLLSHLLQTTSSIVCVWRSIRSQSALPRLPGDISRWSFCPKKFSPCNHSC